MGRIFDVSVQNSPLSVQAVTKMAASSDEMTKKQAQHDDADEDDAAPCLTQICPKRTEWLQNDDEMAAVHDAYDRSDVVAAEHENHAVVAVHGRVS